MSTGIDSSEIMFKISICCIPNCFLRRGLGIWEEKQDCTRQCLVYRVHMLSLSCRGPQAQDGTKHTLVTSASQGTQGPSLISSLNIPPKWHHKPGLWHCRSEAPGENITVYSCLYGNQSALPSLGGTLSSEAYTVDPGEKAWADVRGKTKEMKGDIPIVPGEDKLYGENTPCGQSKRKMVL